MSKRMDKRIESIFGAGLFLVSLFFSTSVYAVINDHLSGYAWSDAGGWFSFSCLNTGTCAAIDYSVEIDQDGDVSGYAWNDSFGWISFQASDITGCPAGVCQPNVDSDGNFSGWAKILSEGSDGWVSLSGTSPDYGVTYNSVTNELEGWAWSDFVGWISFNHKGCDADENGFSDQPSISETGYILDVDYGGTGQVIESLSGVYYLDGYVYAVSSGEDSLSVIDVSSSTNPTEVGYVQDNSQGGAAQVLDGASDVFVFGNYAYVTAISDNALSIIDISNKANPIEVGYVQDTESGGTAQVLDGASGVYVLDGYAYVSVSHDEGFTIIDVSSSTNPTEVGYVRDTESGGTAQVLDAAYDVHVVGDYAYVVSYHDHGLSIIDISNKTNPTEVGYIQDDSQGGVAQVLWNPSSIFVDGDYAYLSSYSDSGLSIINISSSTNPVEVGYIQDTGAGGTAEALSMATKVHVSGDYAYVASHGDDGVSVVDISDKAAPTEVTYIKDDSQGGSAQTLDYPSSMYFSGGFLYVGAFNDRGLSVIEVEKSGCPAFGTAAPDYAVVSDNLAPDAPIISGPTAGDRNASYTFYFHSTDFQIEHESTLTDDATTLLGTPTDVFVLNDYAYVTNSNSADKGLEIIDVSNPANPTHAGSVAYGGDIYSGPIRIFYESVQGRLYTVSRRDNGLKVFDLSNPTSPAHLGTLSFAMFGGGPYINFPEGFSVSDGYAYVTTYNTKDGVEVIDVSDPSNMFKVGAIYNDTIPALNYSKDVYVDGDTDRAYVAGYHGDAIVVLDVSIPATPTFVSQFSDTDEAEVNGAKEVYMKDDYLYVVGEVDSGFEILDASNPSNLIHNGAVADYYADNPRPLWGPVDVHTSGGYAYVVANGQGALSVMDISDPFDPQMITYIMEGDDVPLQGVNGVYTTGDYVYTTSAEGFGIFGVKNDRVRYGIDWDNDSEIDEWTGYNSADYLAQASHVWTTAGTHTFKVLTEDDRGSRSGWSSYSIVIPDNVEPREPVISGRTQGLTNENYGFSFKGLDMVTAHSNSLKDNSAFALGDPMGIAVDKTGDYAYIASYDDNGLEVVDISDPTNPTHVNALFDSFNVENAHVYGDNLYTSGYYFRMYDISTPESPAYLGGLTSGFSGSHSVAATGTYAFVTGFYNHIFNLKVVDVSNPSSPSVITTLVDDGTVELSGAYDIVIDGAYAYIAGFSDNGIQVYDISEPTSIVPVSSIQNVSGVTALDGPMGLFIKDDYLYVVSRSGPYGLEIIDISDPLSPTHVGAIFSETGHYFRQPTNVYVSGDYAFITAYYDDGVEIVDVSDPTNPEHYAFVSNNTATELNGPHDIQVVGDYILVSGKDDDGLEILRIVNDQIKYGVDWDNDGNVNEWLPSSGYATSGTMLYATTSWSTASLKTIKAIAVDDESASSTTWGMYMIDIKVPILPSASITYPYYKVPVMAPTHLQGAFSDNGSGNDFAGYYWYTGEGDCGDTLIYSYSGVVPVPDNPASTPSMHFADGTTTVYLMVEDSYGSTSTCDSRVITIGTECSDKEDNDDGADEEPETWFDDGDNGSGASTTLADPGCFNYTDDEFIELLYSPTSTDAELLAYFASSTSFEGNNPQCSDGRDNDGDGLVDAEDSGCHTNYIAASSTTYSKFINREQTCGVDTNGVICDPDESFGTCPIDCAAQFQFIEF